MNIDISYNWAGENGGGVYNNCDWNGSTNSGGTGYHNFEQILMVQNVAGDGNSNYYGGAICTKQAFSSINSTFTENWVKKGSGGAIACLPYWDASNKEQRVNPSFFNSILWGDQKGFLQTDNEVYCGGDSCDPQFTYCDIKAWVNSNVPGFDVLAPNGWDDFGWSCSTINFDSDPIFSDPNNHDFSLLSNSPCIDTGNVNLATSYGFLSFGSWFNFVWYADLYGNNRVNNDSIDIGIYEDPSKRTVFHPLAQGEGLTRIKVYPKPVSFNQSLFIHCDSFSCKTVEIEVFNTFGQCIYTGPLNSEQPTTIEIPVQSVFPMTGFYIIRIHCFNGKKEIILSENISVI